MLKGVNRQIVEITDTKNPYFERMFLVVRNQCADCPSPLLDQEAHKLLHLPAAYSGLKRARRRYVGMQLFWMSLGAVIGAAFAQLLFH